MVKQGEIQKQKTLELGAWEIKEMVVKSESFGVN